MIGKGLVALSAYHPCQPFFEIFQPVTLKLVPFGSDPFIIAVPNDCLAVLGQRWYRLLDANTPLWKRVRLTHGLGTKAASRAMKSRGSKMTCVVPSR